MKFNPLIALSIAVSTFLPTSHLMADATFVITESYSGVAGEDGTEDWIEVTNFGNMAGDTSTLFYEDSSADPTIAQQLPVFILQPGESAVVLVGVGAADQMSAIDEFNTIWNGVSNVGAIDGGGLGGGGDSIVLFDSTDPMANIIDMVSYPEELVDFLLNTEGDGTQVYATIQYSLGGTPFASSLASGTSNPFFNDNLGASNDQIRLAGSPGVAAIPEPSSAIVLALAMCGLVRRRR